MKPNLLPALLMFALLNMPGLAITAFAQGQRTPVVPSREELERPFGKSDKDLFLAPPKVYHPETWFHFIGGNVAKEGITKDLEAIAGAGFSGITFFHGQFGGPWPGVEPQIASLSPNWDDAVRYTAQECRRLGLNFSMNNCPGWATSGGPWIEASNAMRSLIESRTDVTGGKRIDTVLPLPAPSGEPWRDYKEIAVLAFPTPSGDSGRPLKPESAESDVDADWPSYLSGTAEKAVVLPPAGSGRPHHIDVSFTTPTLMRSVEFSSVQAFNHSHSYEPGVTVSIQAISAEGKVIDILKTDMPQSNWQDDQPITLACSEMPLIKKYRISISNKYEMKLSSLRLFTAARKNSWESEAAWTLRSLERKGENPKQSAAAFIDPREIVDLSAKMDTQGKLHWQAPKGDWTILRFGHVNSGKENGPAPKEGTGWEANKLAGSGADAQFAGYLGRLSAANGPLAGGLLTGMSIDSWECHTQSWTGAMESEFRKVASYPLRNWLPALFGFVVKDHATSARFLTDWRRTLNQLFSTNFYGRMSSLARKNGLSVSYETSAGDVLPGDILEYFKYADVPMCEFWQPMSEAFVGSANFKPVKPTVSAARMYGKPRVGAEAFTSFALTWDEHFQLLKEVANCNTADGVTHYVFHTYTHNPQMPFLPPGTSFGAGIGTPFLRGQTWWKYMPGFTSYLSRCTYMLERGRPVSDVLWYLGDELDHKPDQNAPFPSGYKYDYCNPDVLLNRLKVENGMLVTPEGIQYRLLWLPDAPHMLPQTLEKISALIREGATVVGEAPLSVATLSGGAQSVKQFDAAVKKIWGAKQKGISKNGNGYIISGITLEQALTALKMSPDVTGGDALWLHRKVEGADWYFVSAPQGKGFTGRLSFRQTGTAERWDPVTGETKKIRSERVAGRTVTDLDLVQSAACFIVFRKDSKLGAVAGPLAASAVAVNPGPSSKLITGPWRLEFPSGWGITQPLTLTNLRPWKDLDLSPEGKAFSGTAVYSTGFTADSVILGQSFVLDLGAVDMAATIRVNGREAGTLWAPPYRISLKDLIRKGSNTLTIEVTSTWFNRLVFDAGQVEEKRKTWTINGPEKNAPLRNSGLMGPVTISVVAATEE